MKNSFIRFLGGALFLSALCWVALTPVHKAARASEAAIEKSGQLGIGAIGRIEPKSRVIGLSHDQGPDGARIAHLLVQEGQNVLAGEDLVTFSDFDRRKSEVDMMQARLQSVKARKGTFEAENADAAANYKRHKLLRGTPAISESSYDEALARLRKAESELQAIVFDIDTIAAELKLSEQRLEQSMLRAPIAGTILKIYARPGERVASAPILDIADLSALDVVADIYEDDLPRVKVGQVAQITFSGSAQAYKAQVREIGFLVQKNDLNDTDPLADRDSRVIQVRLTLDPVAVPHFRNQIYRQVQVKISP